MTLPPELDSLLVRLALLQGKSKAQVLRDLFEAAEPALRRAASLMEAASTATSEVHFGLRDSMMRAQEHIEMLAAEHIGLEPVEGGGQAKGGTRLRGVPARSAGAKTAVPHESTPVLVTRGSGSGKTLRSR